MPTVKPRNPWDDSTDFITQYEGFSDTAYTKKGDKPTIGYGTTNPKWVSKGRITKAQARQAMAEDLAINEPLLRKNIKNYDNLPDTAKTVLRDILYNVGQGNLFNKSPKFMAAINAGDWQEAARQMDWDNNKPGFAGARRRNAARQKLFLEGFGVQPAVPEQTITPYVAPSDATAVRQIIPEEQTRARWTGAEQVSPYVTGKPTVRLQPVVRMPDLIEAMEDSEWEAPFLITPSYKNGKLPKFKDGINLGSNPTNATVNDDGTFTDDYTRVFDDLVITPSGARVKSGQLYKYQEPWDDVEFLNAVTAGGLNNLSPALWVRRGYDAITGNLTVDSWLNGNNGVVTDNFAQNHPYWTVAANTIFDAAALGGPKFIKGRSFNPKQQIKDTGGWNDWGSESYVKQDGENFLKIPKRGFNATDSYSYKEAVRRKLAQNKVPGFEPYSYEGWILNGDSYYPVFKLRALTQYSDATREGARINRQILKDIEKLQSGKYGAWRLWGVGDYNAGHNIGMSKDGVGKIYDLTFSQDPISYLSDNFDFSTLPVKSTSVINAVRQKIKKR